MQESRELLNEPGAKDNEKDSNACIVTQKQIIIRFNGAKFQVSRQIKTIEDVQFTKFGNNMDRENHEESIEIFQFVCMYGMLQLSKTPVFIFVLKSEQVGNINKNIIYEVTKIKIVKVRYNEQQPFLSSLQRSFQLFKLYHCREYDLSKRLQSQFDKNSYSQQQYFSNFIHTLHYDTYPSELLTVFINGFARTEEMPISDKKMRVTLVSRGDYHRLGRRWLRRGIDQRGYAANQYQTQIIVQVMSVQKHQIFSYVQQRGSIPLFWEQLPCFQFKASLRICQDDAKNERYLKYYLSTLIERYKSVVLLNLVYKTGRQSQIGSAFQQYFNRVNPQKTRFIWFDYGEQYSRKQKKAFQQLISDLKADLIGNYFSISTSKDREFEVKTEQKKVIRTNCMDCLDRTNYIQSIICKAVCIQLEALINCQAMGEVQSLKLQSQQFQKIFKSMWKANGIAISKQYSGTSTMKNDFADYGKRTLGGIFNDFCIGLHRFYLGHFVDYYNQNCIDLHFGKINFEQDGTKFKGLWWKRVFKWIAFSGIWMIPLLLSHKISEICNKKNQQYAAFAGTSFLGLILGGIICKIGGKALIQQPISRRYELI